VTLTDWASGTELPWMAEARPLARLFGSRRGPVSVARADPALWLGIWLAGGIVRWDPEGLSGVAWTEAAAPGATPAGLDPAAPALIWPGPEGERVFSHRAVFWAVRDSMEMGAIGRGLAGPASVVQAMALAMAGIEREATNWLWPDPDWPAAWSDGRRRWHYSSDLLGLWAEVRDDGSLMAGAATWYDQGLVRSRRLFDGYWQGGRPEPTRAEPGGWHRLSSPVRWHTNRRRA
jgi:hypothetical protein